MSSAKRVFLALIVVAFAFGGWWYFIRDPGRVDNTLFHPETFQIAADVDGKPVPKTIGFSDPISIRFRGPVPIGLNSKSKFNAYLYVVNPKTYRNSDVTEAHRQVYGGPFVSLTIGSSPRVKDVTPPFPGKDENVLQFCALLSGKSLLHAKVGLPLEMHLWLYPVETMPDGQENVSQSGEWVFRHSFEFVDSTSPK